MSKKLTLGIINLLFVHVIFAQQPTFEKITTTNGLSQNNIHTILEDHYGYLWFGTDDGLNKYNGYDFKVFQRNFSKSTGLDTNLILALKQDPEHNIWLGTADKGVIIYDYLKEQFLPFSPKNCSTNLFENTRVIDFDFLPNKDILILTPYEVFVFEKKDNGYYLKKNKNSLVIWDGVFRKILRNQNEIFINSIKGLYTLEHEQNDSYTLDRNSIFGKNHIKNLIPFKNQYILNFNGKILFWDGKEKRTPASDKTFLNILLDKQNKLWAVSKKGIHRFDVETKEIFTLKNELFIDILKGEQSSMMPDILSIYQNKTGFIWLGTRDHGIFKINPRGNYFSTIAAPFSSRVNTIFEDSNNNLWIGTNKERAFIRRNFKNPESKFEKIDLGLFRTRNVLAFHEIEIDDQNYVVSGTHFKSNHRKHLLTETAVENSLLSKKLVDSIVFPVYTFASQRNELWMGTYDQGIMKYDVKKDTLITYLPFNSNLPSKVIRNLYFDSKERLWIATDKGLCLLEPEEIESGQPIFKIFQHKAQDTTTISHDYTIPIIETKNQQIWVGTLGGGLNKYNETTESFTRFTSKDGLPNNNIKGILEDDAENLWVSSNRGLSKINLNSYDITNFGIEDGLQDYEFSDLSCCKLSDGRLAFGGILGLNIFDPKKIESKSTPPKLVFDNLQVLNTEIGPKEKFNGRIILEKNLNETHFLDLKHKENSFIIGFTAVSFDSPKKIQYEYKLEGFDKEWIKTDWKSRFAKYTSLKSGNYTFMLRAGNSSDVANAEPITIDIKIDRPFWFSNLAILCYLFITGLIAFLIFRYIHVKKESKKALLKAEIEKESTKELTQLKLRFFTNISHELRTPLTIINGYIDQLSKKWNAKLPETNDFEVIKRNTNVLLRLVNQLLDFRKFEQGKLNLNTSENNLIEFVNKVFESFEILAQKKNISFFTTHNLIDEQLVFDTDKMDKILNNILSNAFRHTNEGGIININLTDDENYTTIAITDNGSGIPKDKQKIIFDRFYVAENFEEFNVKNTGIGLSFTKSLIEMHDGEISLDSELGKGTTFYLKFKKNLPLHRKETIVREESYAFVDKSTNTSDSKIKPNFADLSIRHKILIVEDNDDLLNYLSENFQKNYLVYTAANGREGLEQCTKHHPDIVISDVMMPLMNGFELCHSIKQHQSLGHTPVILLTAKFTDTSEIEGFNEGADAYVTKPFNIEVLEARVKSLINSRQRIWEQFKAHPISAKLEGNFTTSDEKFIRDVVTLIQKNLSDSSFSVEQLASSFSMSQPTFIKKMKALIGETPNRYIRSIKMNKAAELLVQTDLNVSEIIYKVGFTDVKYFREQFKKTFNTTPSSYRKNESTNKTKLS